MKAIIFDCYGVLVGTGFWNVYQSLGGDTKKDKQFITEQLDRVNSGKISSQNFSKVMAHRINVTVSVYNEAFKNDEQPDEKMFEFIKHKLRPNYKLALVSNATGDSVRRKIPAEKLALFDEVLISGEVGLLKPDPRLFNLALKRLGVKPDEAMFVDDHEEYILGAKDVGLNTILYSNFDNFKKQLSKF